ncbi:MYG1 family protein [Candidatus Woesearchaeota archaeon]|nr:MYG1 family protein [Candidatus Woesearchaeota archaeon]
MALEGKIGTVAVHNGNFHSDDVFAVAALKMIDPDLQVVRTRNPDDISSADARVDVGGEYDHEKRSYDHHQRGGAGERENGIAYSSFGLVWKHYGAEICGSQEIADRIDEGLVQRIDGTDTGSFKVDTTEMGPAYLHLSINSLNPSWHEENADYDAAFAKAVNFAYAILNGIIKNNQGIELAVQESKAAINAAEDPDYVVLDRFCPWQETIVQESDAKYVVHPNQNGAWMVAAVPTEPFARNYRQPLPEQWAGLREAELQEVTGVQDAIFCHNARFIAGAKSLEGAKKLAKLANNYEV